jgi:hypothetical protein
VTTRVQRGAGRPAGRGGRGGPGGAGRGRGLAGSKPLLHLCVHSAGQARVAGVVSLHRSLVAPASALDGSSFSRPGQPGDALRVSQ